ncbi:MAG: hypothetical protein V3V08_23490 [Nannocystaceae bacterium]
MDTHTASKIELVSATWRIPAELDEALEHAWLRQRVDGNKESKQSLAARALEAGLKQIARKAKR